MIQAKFGLNSPNGFRGEDFWKSLQTDDGRQDYGWGPHPPSNINWKLVKNFIKKNFILKSCKESNANKPYGKNAYVVFFQNFDWRPPAVIQRGRFETGGTMGYNCYFFLSFVPLHIESPYNFGGAGPIFGVKNPLQRVNGNADNLCESCQEAPKHIRNRHDTDKWSICVYQRLCCLNSENVSGNLSKLHVVFSLCMILSLSCEWINILSSTW
jgi:hypothetical protein